MITLPCGDINSDGYIDSADLGTIILPRNYGKQITDEGVDPLADLEGVGCVDSGSISVIILPVNYNKTHIVYPYTDKP